MNDILQKLKFLKQNNDLVVAVGVIFILAMMIIPIHPFLLDFFLVISLSFSIIVLLMSIYTKRPLDFSTFPSFLLVMTLFRLSLNVASTRNILLNGGSEGTQAAGSIIQSFGEFVVEGNYVVGIIVFLTLVIINFMVITKGAGRIAEVAARFTLDAMPGKQMAIDADLNARLINEQEARARRKEVSEEADFYGSMDGASKFVRGDAIASILITGINIVGGIIVGVIQSGMDISNAAEVFTLLTTGDGLVTQIPALIVSTAAGIIITRNTNEDNLGNQVIKQFKIHPKAIYMASAILVFFGLIPGLPQSPFIFTGLIFTLLGYRLEKSSEQDKMDIIKKNVEGEKASSDDLEKLLNLDLVELEVGYGLVNLVDSSQDGDLLERITYIRKQFVLDWGVIIPSIRIKDNLELQPGGYSVKIKGVEVAKGDLMIDHFMAMDPGNVVEKLSGVETTEPVFGLQAIWITEEQKEEAEYNGYTVVDLSSIIATHLTELLKNNLSELFGRQELVRIIDNFKESYPKIVNDLIPEILSLGQVLKVLQNLLRENISIRDLRTILETLAEHGASIKDADILTEYTRQALFRTITESIKSGQGDIPIFTLDGKIEESIIQNITQTEQGQKLNLSPEITQSILSSLSEKIEEATSSGEKMVILCSPKIRNHFKRLTEKFIPNLTVISHSELGPDANIRSLGMVRL